MPIPSDQILYPQAVDYFPEVADGDGPENIIHGAHVNLVQNALVAVQAHCQYAVVSHDAGGPLLYCLTTSYRVPRNTERRKMGLVFEVPQADAALYFGGKPFYRTRGILISASAYRRRDGERFYFQVQSAVHVPDENGRQARAICWKMHDEWARGDVIEAQLMILEP